MKDCQVIIRGMINYFKTHDMWFGFADILERQPKYFKAIMDNITLADKACIEGDVIKTKDYARKAMGYYKKALMIIREIKNDRF